jgi:hypothetical protein
MSFSMPVMFARIFTWLPNPSVAVFAVSLPMMMI